jgi:16S rRNA (guanine966-N2)-methyltransferase
MRIVSGKAGGIPLHVPSDAGAGLRPTMDRVKAAIFSTLGDSVVETRVLDLFAGVGGLGLEALSRGATSCLFIENDRQACESLRRNLGKSRLAGGEVLCADALEWLERSAGADAFQLIFADPPYCKYPGERDFTAELLACVALQRALTAGGLFILEHLPGATLPLGETWECLRQKRYGATEVAFLRKKSASPVELPE